MNIYRNPTDRNKKLQEIKKKTSGDPEKVYMTKDFENCRKSRKTNETNTTNKK